MKLKSMITLTEVSALVQEVNVYKYLLTIDPTRYNPQSNLLLFIKTKKSSYITTYKLEITVQRKLTTRHAFYKDSVVPVKTMTLSGLYHAILGEMG